LTPPTDLVMPPLWQMVFLISTGIVMIFTIIYAIRALLKEKDFVPILSLFGGLMVAGTVELVIGPLGYLWYPAIGQNAFVRANGTSIPLFVATGNAFWYGPGLILFGNLVYTASSKKKIWLLFGGALLADVFMEVVGVPVGVFTYYGNHGLRFFGIPLWWLVQNGALTVCIAWIVTSLRKSFLKGWKSVLIIPIVPCLSMAINAFIGMFAWLGIRTTSTWSVYAGTLASIGMALLAVDILTHIQQYCRQK